MPTIKINPSMQLVLADLKEVTEVLDGDGNLIGVFKPKCKVEAELYAAAAKLFDPQELDRRLREEGGKGVPYAEVKRRLQVLEAQG